MYSLFSIRDCRWPPAAFLCVLARPEAPLVGCPSRPLGGFVLAVSSISWLPVVVLGLDGFSLLLSLTFPKSVSSQPSSSFSMYLPNSPTVIGSFHSTSIALNNASHKFWNLSKTGQSIADVSGLPEQTRLTCGVTLVLSA